MPTNAETIAKLAKQLEQQKILNELENCRTLEDYEKLKEDYRVICSKQD